jgi:hypothetical protein
MRRRLALALPLALVACIGPRPVLPPPLPTRTASLRLAEGRAHGKLVTAWLSAEQAARW